MTHLEPWTLLQIANDYDRKLYDPRLTSSGREYLRTIAVSELKQRATEFMKTRRLTPGEVTVLERYGVAL